MNGEDVVITTPFCVIYDKFLSSITEDLYLEYTYEDTCRDAEEILLKAIPQFEFPRFPIYNYNLEEEVITQDGEKSRGVFNAKLTLEEIDILADLMALEWLSRQILSVDNTRLKYSGSDFKFTSQANHIDKLLKAQDKFAQKNRHIQRLYKRRKVGSDGRVTSNLSVLAGGVLRGSRD